MCYFLISHPFSIGNALILTTSLLVVGWDLGRMAIATCLITDITIATITLFTRHFTPYLALLMVLMDVLI